MLKSETKVAVGPGWIAWLAAMSVAASAAALSFAALAELARVSGVPAELAPLLPITIDAGVLVSAKFWLTPSLATRVTNFARNLTLCLIVVSSAGNVAGHWYAAMPPEHFWLSALVSLVAPLTLAAIAHLIVIARVPEKEAKLHATVLPPTKDEAPGKVAAPLAQIDRPVIEAPAPLVPLLKRTAEPVAAAETKAPEVRVTLPAPPPRAAAKPQDRNEEPGMGADPRVDQIIAWAREEGSMPSQRKVIDRFKVHNTTAKQLVDAAKAAQVNGAEL